MNEEIIVAVYATKLMQTPPCEIWKRPTCRQLQ